MSCLEGGEVIGSKELALGSGPSKQVCDSQAGVKAGRGGSECLKAGRGGSECLKAGRGGSECLKAGRGGAKL